MAKPGKHNQTGQGTPQKIQPNSAEHEFAEDMDRLERVVKSRTKILTRYNIITGVISAATLATALYSAYQTRRSVDSQVRAMELQYRPWLAAKGFAPPKWDGTANDLFEWTVTNAGPVPAEGKWDASVSIYDHEPTVAELIPTPDKLTRRFTLGASQEMAFYTFTKQVRDSSLFVKAMDGSMMLYACVVLSFTGADKSKPPYYYRQCMKYDALRKVWNTHTPE